MPSPPLLTSPVLTARLPGAATGLFRLHAGNARILYAVDDEASIVYIINIGRLL